MGISRKPLPFGTPKLGINYSALHPSELKEDTGLPRDKELCYFLDILSVYYAKDNNNENPTYKDLQRIYASMYTTQVDTDVTKANWVKDFMNRFNKRANRQEWGLEAGHATDCTRDLDRDGNPIRNEDGTVKKHFVCCRSAKGSRTNIHGREKLVWLDPHFRRDLFLNVGDADIPTPPEPSASSSKRKRTESTTSNKRSKSMEDFSEEIMEPIVTDVRDRWEEEAMQDRQAEHWRGIQSALEKNEVDAEGSSDDEDYVVETVRYTNQWDNYNQTPNETNDMYELFDTQRGGELFGTHNGDLTMESTQPIPDSQPTDYSNISFTDLLDGFDLPPQPAWDSLEDATFDLALEELESSGVSSGTGYHENLWSDLDFSSFGDVNTGGFDGIDETLQSLFLPLDLPDLDFELPVASMVF